MFGETLRELRTNIHLSVARLAELTGTSRSAITDYEAGRKIPRLDTAERILRTFGQTYAAVQYLKPRPVRLDEEVLTPLYTSIADREQAVKKARRDQAVIVDADANAERLDVTWGQVKTLVDGTTVTGDELSVWRVGELRDSAIAILREIETGREPQLHVIARGELVMSNQELDVPRRAIDYLVRATSQGADPAFVRHQVGGFLAHHGYPWLWVPHRLVEEYHRALVACMRQGEGNLMASILVASIEKG